MNIIRSASGLITVITLLMGVIWLTPTSAHALSFASLGQIEADAMRVPAAMDLDDAGNLYVADARGGKLHTFSPYGQLLRSFQVKATGRGVAVTPDGTKLYVSRQQESSAAHEVWILDARTGEILGALSGAETEGAEFGVAGEIDLDSAGRVYVADNARMQIKIYDADGAYQNRFGGVGATAGLFRQIGGMAISPADKVVVADSSFENGQVHVFTLASDLTVASVVSVLKSATASFGSPIMHSPRGLTFDNLGRGYFLEFQSSQLRVTSSTFVFQSPAYINVGHGGGQLKNVIDAIYDRVNNRLFISCDDGRIVILGVDGGSNPLNPNVAPTTPLPQSPLGGDQVASATPALVFENASDANGDSLTYQVVVKQGDTVVFQTSVAGQAGTTTTVTVSEPLVENQSYAWTVQANDGKLSSPLSAAAFFVVNAVDEPPSVPAPVAPLAGESINERYELSWDASIDPDPNGHEGLNYLVAVSQDAQVIFEAEVAATSVQLDAALLTENLAYSWTVQGKDAGGNLSDISPAANFVVNFIDEPPSVPELTAPLHGESLNGAGELAWLASSDPDPNDDDANITYRIEVATDAAFTTLVATAEPLTELALSLSSLPSYADLVIGESFFWRVIAIGHDRLESAPSASGHFLFATTALTLTSNMPGTRVFLHGNHAYAGQSIGTAPLHLRDIDPVVMSVVVERDGFEPFVGQVALVEGQNVSLYARLVAARDVGELNTGTPIQFGKSKFSASGPAAPFVVDFDNDGDFDLLVGYGSGQIALYADLQMSRINKLDAMAAVPLPLPVMPGAVPFMADWNNDGRKDLLVGQADGTVKLFMNVGLEESPAFSAGVDLTTVNGVLNVGGSAAPVVADYNGDGAKDLLVGNAAGQVLVFLNEGSDAVPELSAAGVVMQVAGAVVPLRVDWDADGQKDLLLTVNGAVAVYKLVDGAYQLDRTIVSAIRAANFAAFPVDLFATGRLLLSGDVDGKVTAFLPGTGLATVASFHAALLDKVAELGALVGEENPPLLDEVTALEGLVAAGSYTDAALAANALAGQLAAGPARTSALELAELCSF